MAPQELENSASKYAADAIKADSQGAYGMAISGYQNASATLMKLMRLYPDSKLNQIYTERISAYRSEEHTSELQSLVNLVCRLLLEKKKEKQRQ